MSVQFGIWNLDGRPVDVQSIERVISISSAFGLGGGGTFTRENTSILYFAFHTTKESREEVQPFLMVSDEVITWDGRLDNRTQLISDIGTMISSDATDIEIVAAAYERWGMDCFCKLLGDWAIAIWNSKMHRLILARDTIGIRQLYYRRAKDQIIWSTLLDPLVLLSDKPLKLNEEYVAGWLSRYPATNLTPYVGIHSVPACAYVVLRPSRHEIAQYWQFDPAKRIRYSTDREYEEHFRVVFRQAVRRRLRSDNSVLAELSGGMDSVSIVCMADHIISSGETDTPRLDTISLYSESEPNWDERPYFTKVEERRGRTGLHIRIEPEQMFSSVLHNGSLESTPACTAFRIAQSIKSLTQPLDARVVLSGVGGDEVMGGVPTPIPELQDLLTRARLRQLVHRLKIWALEKRSPWLHLLADAIREFLPQAFVSSKDSQRSNPWLNPDFFSRNRQAFNGYQGRLRFFGPPPSFQANVNTISQLQRQLACNASACAPNSETRYPYLDRDLLEFMYAIPRCQVVRPGCRRSLMRRAMAGLVPDEILERKRKAFGVRGPTVAISSEWNFLSELMKHMRSAALGMVDPEGFLAVMQKARNNGDVPLPRLVRTLSVEFWIENLRQHGISVGAEAECGVRHTSF